MGDASAFENASAKVNLALHVLGQRTDGYHLLDSLVTFCEYGDRVFASPSDGYSLDITGPFAHQLDDCSLDNNLMTKAHDLLKDYAVKQGFEAHPVHLTCEKNMPVASGIGGGSSDAAATLRLLSRTWKLNLQPEELAKIGIQIGADVPMCIHQKPLMARGIGDEIKLVEGMPHLSMVLINPLINVSTPEVFKALTHKDNAPLPIKTKFSDLEQLVAYLKSTRNDLEAPAISTQPDISYCLKALEETNADLARMSGSGATCFGIYHSNEEAISAANYLQTKFPNYFVTHTNTRG